MMESTAAKKKSGGRLETVLQTLRRRRYLHRGDHLGQVCDLVLIKRSLIKVFMIF